jgi:hypothetical protein
MFQQMKRTILVPFKKKKVSSSDGHLSLFKTGLFPMFDYSTTIFNGKDFILKI